MSGFGQALDIFVGGFEVSEAIGGEEGVGAGAEAEPGLVVPVGKVVPATMARFGPVANLVLLVAGCAQELRGLFIAVGGFVRVGLGDAPGGDASREHRPFLDDKAVA